MNDENMELNRGTKEKKTIEKRKLKLQMKTRKPRE
jgi:hypothetical protein